MTNTTLAHYLKDCLIPGENTGLARPAASMEETRGQQGPTSHCGLPAQDGTPRAPTRTRSGARQQGIRPRPRSGGTAPEPGHSKAQGCPTPQTSPTAPQGPVQQHMVVDSPHLSTHHLAWLPVPKMPGPASAFRVALALSG